MTGARFSRRLALLQLFALGGLGLVGCGRGSAAPTPASSGPTAALCDGAEGRVSVVATTSIIADVVSNVGGKAVRVQALLPIGADPHAYEVTRQDLAIMDQAALIFVNGAGLEQSILSQLPAVARPGQVIDLSAGLELIAGHEHESQHGQEEPEEHHDEEMDPHVWLDPGNVSQWAEQIAAALGQADPACAGYYAERARLYQAKLRELDEWIAREVQRIPPERRLLVADHDALGYFARRYGLRVVGSAFPGLSTLAEPSAQEVAQLEDAIRSLGVPAIFLSSTVSPSLVQRIAQDTGVRLVTLYIGSLSGPEGPAATYIDMMRYNVQAIVSALSGEGTQP